MKALEKIVFSRRFEFADLIIISKHKPTHAGPSEKPPNQCINHENYTNVEIKIRNKQFVRDSG